MAEACGCSRMSVLRHGLLLRCRKTCFESQLGSSCVRMFSRRTSIEGCSSCMPFSAGNPLSSQWRELLPGPCQVRPGDPVHTYALHFLVAVFRSCSCCPAALNCRICAQARTTKSKSKKQAADLHRSSLGNGSGAGLARWLSLQGRWGFWQAA